MSEFNFNKAVIAAAISFALLAPTTDAQNLNVQRLGSLQIAVIDKKVKRQLAGATIIVTDRANNSKTYQVNDNGQVSIEGLMPGLYSVEALKDGYMTVYESSLRVTANKVTSAKLIMPENSQKIEVISLIGNQTAKSDSGPISTTYMDRESLRSAIGGGSDVLRALDGMPGLTSTGEFASFSVRGRGPEDNIIYVDNMPFDKVVHFDSSLGELENIGGGGRFSIFAPNLIEGAEFSPGGWGASYGGKAGSLLKLDVIDGAATPTVSLRLDLAGFEVGYEGPSGFDDDTRVVFNARQLDFGRFFDTLGENDIGAPVLSDVLFKSVTDIVYGHSVEFLYIDSPEEFRKDTEHVVEDEFLEADLTFREQNSRLIGLTWNALIGDESELKTNIYYRTSDKFSSMGESYPDAVEAGSPHEDFPARYDIYTRAEDETEIGLRSDFSTFNRFGELTVGFEARSFDLTFDTQLNEQWNLFIFEQDDDRPNPEQKYIVLQPEFLTAFYDISATSYGAYVDQSIEFDQWKFNAGVRYDYDDLSGESLISPRVNLTWDASVDAKYSLSAGTFYQSPSFLDRASDARNAELANEKVTHVSLGGDWRLSQQYSLLAELYYQKLDNLVVGSNRTDGLLTNDGEGTSFGFDTVLTKYFSDDWSGVATYSYNQSKRDDNDGLGEYDADYHRPHVLSLGVKWEMSDRWKFGARWKYLSGQPTDEYIIHQDIFSDGIITRSSQEYITNNTIRYGDIHQLNVRVDYFRTFGPVNVIAFLDIVNLLGTTVDGSDSFDVKTGQFIEEDGDTFPMIGLKFEMSF